MATYAVGDIQGCLDKLCHLLEHAKFKPAKDTLWVVGDLINRGPQSLETLRFIKDLPSMKVVLGNHDLHLLAVAKGYKKPNRKDTLQPILDAEDRDELLSWLQSQPLVYHDTDLGFTMVHAGIPPIWSIEQACAYSKEVQQKLASDSCDEFFANMYGNEPSTWNENLRGAERLRLITNYLTRMRFCSAQGELELATKLGPECAPEGFLPWFEHENHACAEHKILFGHWASLQGKCSRENFIALDTGCVWGGCLTMLRLDDQKYFSIDCGC